MDKFWRGFNLAIGHNVTFGEDLIWQMMNFIKFGGDLNWQILAKFAKFNPKGRGAGIRDFCITVLGLFYPVSKTQLELDRLLLFEYFITKIYFLSLIHI